jgi:hypothetical protein
MILSTSSKRDEIKYKWEWGNGITLEMDVVKMDRTNK